MIKMPDMKKMYEYETFYHLTLDPSRLGKLVAHYEIYKMIMHLPGSIVECGVFKGTSLVRFAMLRELLSNYSSVKIIGFDVFSDDFPQTSYQEDQKTRKEWIESAGGSSISVSQLKEIFQMHQIKNYELIEGDVCKTVPEYLTEHPELRISLLNLDIDFMEPNICVLEHFYPRIVKGGVLILDNYTATHGDTKAVDEYFKDKKVSIKRFNFCSRPSYIVKE